jgi:hypothetical protein
MFVFVTQDPCGPERHDCACQLMAFRDQYSLNYQPNPPYLMVLTRQQIRGF